MNHDFIHRSSARTAKNKTYRFQHTGVQLENPLMMMITDFAKSAKSGENGRIWDLPILGGDPRRALRAFSSQTLRDLHLSPRAPPRAVLPPRVAAPIQQNPLQQDPIHHNYRSSAQSAKNKTGRFQHMDVQFENPLDSAKNKTGRFQQRNASAQSAKNKTGRFQHRNVQFENPLCHDPLPYVVRLEERLHFMFLIITQLNDVLTSRIL